MKTVEDAVRIIEQFEELQEKAASVATQMIELKEERPCSIDGDDITVECGRLYANWEYYHGCDDYESRQLEIPIEYLFDEIWMDKAKEKIKEERRMKIILAMKREERERQEALDRDRKHYLELKDKFEGEDR